MGEYTFVYIWAIAVVLTALGEQKYLSKADLHLPENIQTYLWMDGLDDVGVQDLWKSHRRVLELYNEFEVYIKFQKLILHANRQLDC